MLFSCTTEGSSNCSSGLSSSQTYRHEHVNALVDLTEVLAVLVHRRQIITGHRHLLGLVLHAQYQLLTRRFKLSSHQPRVSIRFETNV